MRNEDRIPDCGSAWWYFGFAARDDLNSPVGYNPDINPDIIRWVRPASSDAKIEVSQCSRSINISENSRAPTFENRINWRRQLLGCEVELFLRDLREPKVASS